MAIKGAPAGISAMRATTHVSHMRQFDGVVAQQVAADTLTRQVSRNPMWA
jgi:hypothetical protein